MGHNPLHTDVVSPVAFPTVPAGHWMHTVAPSAATYRPTGQAEQDAAPPLLHVPPTHSDGTTVPPGQYAPAGHGATHDAVVSAGTLPK